MTVFLTSGRMLVISLPIASFSSVTVWDYLGILFLLGNQRDKNLGVKDPVAYLVNRHSKPKSKFSMKSIAKKWHALSHPVTPVLVALSGL